MQCLLLHNGAPGRWYLPTPIQSHQARSFRSVRKLVSAHSSKRRIKGRKPELDKFHTAYPRAAQIQSVYRSGSRSRLEPPWKEDAPPVATSRVARPKASDGARAPPNHCDTRTEGCTSQVWKPDFNQKACSECPRYGGGPEQANPRARKERQRWASQCLCARAHNKSEFGRRRRATRQRAEDPNER